jgi:hypothetical protein
MIHKNSYLKHSLIGEYLIQYSEKQHLTVQCDQLCTEHLCV